MDVETCLECGLIEGHTDECLTEWASRLNTEPTKVGKRNPFLAMLKEKDGTETTSSALETSEAPSPSS